MSRCNLVIRQRMPFACAGLATGRGKPHCAASCLLSLRRRGAPRATNIQLQAHGHDAQGLAVASFPPRWNGLLRFPLGFTALITWLFARLNYQLRVTSLWISLDPSRWLAKTSSNVKGAQSHGNPTTCSNWVRGLQELLCFLLVFPLGWDGRSDP